ncbi:hypothetical protein Micbo1qcDRAFT_119079 [Microdochium bolleyi]|uniref:Zn(2)-C6 fungal-type domain-containing protein n=1 Tax=Microdochium bolleyi TaxID=196109 RepID=A0A136J2S4_9PEZI|nr:hypothetical protein Micbo1qcDRAFT_119079 [Microdochium bolleyi]
MASDPSGRRLLPQSSQLNTFAFAPPAYQQLRETQKNYVFVDEHNRHKRLKVMRACEGCRRRKIKCDAATTNTWPCSACIRLKLHCVRPNGLYEGAGDGFESGTDQEYEVAGMQDSFGQVPMPQQSSPPQQHHGSMMAAQSKPGMYPHQAQYADPQGVYPVAYGDGTSMQPGVAYSAMTAPSASLDPNAYASGSVFHTPPAVQTNAPQSASPADSYQHDPYSQPDLSDLLGSLKMNEIGTAPYLNSKNALNNQEDDEPTVEPEDDFSYLPTPGPGSKIRIPPELMPDDETCLHYFGLYFANVHQYVPVLNKAQLYHQFQTNRDSISPLLLEAIFAVAGRLADEPTQGQQWIALASKHLEAFLDVPRLSTVQAHLIILKAREAMPKRGYYYRSWLSIVNCFQMAKDLGLDEHFEDHQEGKSCGASPADCLTKSRVWQTIFACENMIAGSQGRDDLHIKMASVDFSLGRPMAGIDAYELEVSRNFTFLARIVRSVHRMNTVYAKIKRKKDWALDPEFQKLNPAITGWLDELPADMALSFTPDGAPPWLPSHFLGNLHSYYHLSVILCHRPQLNLLDPTHPNGAWKSHMMLSYSSAKALCRIQESMLQSFGLNGLQCMQRGISFTIYSVLACIVLHLVALTSPDPELNGDAREYFTRHMRILERTMEGWPLPEMLKQIDSVRQAFSADIRKPFVLKPSFPYGSPHPSSHSSPPRTDAFKPPMLRTNSVEHSIGTQGTQQSQVSYAYPITPISTGSVDNNSDSPSLQSLGMMATSQGAHATQLHMTDASTAWNPSRIFDQWNTTFGTPLPPPPSESIGENSSPLNLSSAGAPEVPTTVDIQIATTAISPAVQTMTPQQYSSAPVQSYITPAMWQESVASVYEGGLKRSWDYGGDVSLAGQMQKRR